MLLLSLIDAFHVRDLVAKSGAPVQTMLMLVTTYGLMFGIGAALTGLVLTLEDELTANAGPPAAGSTAQAGDRAGDDLHGDADHPSGHDHRYPYQMRIVAQHDHADASERRERREEGADRAEQFRRIDLADPARHRQAGRSMR